MAVVDRQATFTDTSTRISSMEVALWLQSVAVLTMCIIQGEEREGGDRERKQSRYEIIHVYLHVHHVHVAVVCI